MFKLSLKTLLLSTLMLSVGCTSNNFRVALPQEDQDYSLLYLRGVFTWWEADEAFKVEKVGAGLFKAEAKLIADGEPYDFKFADANWTPGLSCGLSESEGNEYLELDKKVTANCIDGAENFKFEPKESGTYSFYIDVTIPESPQVYVTG